MKNVKSWDTVIRAGILVPMNGSVPHGNSNIDPNSLFSLDQGIAIEKGKIVKIDRWEKIQSLLENGQKTSDFIDASHCIAMPGLINAHGHLPMTLLRGLGDDLPFLQWLNERILPLEGRLVNPEFVKLGTELACLESLQAGVTTVADMYYFEDEILKACKGSGIRAFLGESVIDYPVPDDLKKDGSCFEIALRTLEGTRNSETLHFSIAPHAPYSCSDDTLKKVLAFSEKHNCPIQIHVSETEGEVAESLKIHKKTPLKRLHDLGLTRRPLLMAHCVHLTDEEIEIAAQYNCGIAHNPESNMKLGAGIAPIGKFFKAGISVGLGTDSAASNNDIGLFGEMDTAAKLQKMAQKNNTAMRAVDALWMATHGGAKALGLEKITGSLEIGKSADIVCVSTDFPNLQPLHDPLSALVYSARGNEVETVFVNGKKVVSNFKCTTVDEQVLLGTLSEFRKANKF